MALHGSIMVNEQILGYWSAVRGEDTDPPNQVYAYDCEVHLLGLPSRDIKFIEHHTYSKGALALAAKVLLTAHILMKEEDEDE